MPAINQRTPLITQGDKQIVEKQTTSAMRVIHLKNIINSGFSVGPARTQFIKDVLANLFTKTLRTKRWAFPFSSKQTFQPTLTVGDITEVLRYLKIKNESEFESALTQLNKKEGKPVTSAINTLLNKSTNWLHGKDDTLIRLLTDNCLTSVDDVDTKIYPSDRKTIIDYIIREKSLRGRVQWYREHMMEGPSGCTRA